MNYRRFLPIVALLIILITLLNGGCDNLVTERIETTVTDSTLGVGCFDCHTDDDNAFLRPKGQWANSKHGSGASLDEATGCAPDGMACHSHEGYIAKYDAAPSSNSYSAIGCFTCHSPHSYDYAIWDDSLLSLLRGGNESGYDTLANGTVYFLAQTDKSIMCVNCHQTPYDVNTLPTTGDNDITLTFGWGPHHSPQADVLFGTGGYAPGGLNFTSSHTDIVKERDGCLACHYGTGSGYEFGEHTFRLQNDDTGEQYVDNCNVSGCHSQAAITNFDSTSTMLVISVQAAQLHALLASMEVFDVSGRVRIDTAFNPNLIGVIYNYLLYKEDGSRGVHNPNYITALLEESMNQFDMVPVQAHFSASTTVSCAGDSIFFTNNSAGTIDSLRWELGDTTISTTTFDTTLAHVYDSGGTYAVTLVVFGRYVGNVDSLTLTDSLHIAAGLPVASFAAIPDSADFPQLVSFSNSSIDAFDYYWDFGDDGDDDTSSVEEPTYLFDTTGIYTVTLIVSNPCGEDTTTVDVQITESP